MSLTNTQISALLEAIADANENDKLNVSTKQAEQDGGKECPEELERELERKNKWKGKDPLIQKVGEEMGLRERVLMLNTVSFYPLRNAASTFTDIFLSSGKSTRFLLQWYISSQYICRFIMNGSHFRCGRKGVWDSSDGESWHRSVGDYTT
jgi:hypothetical protein